MVNEINDEFITSSMDELINLFGVRKDADYHYLLTFLQKNKPQRCIKEIALQLGLPVEINLSYISKAYKAGDANRFESSDLVVTNKKGQGFDSITAQVTIPHYLPFYGSLEMENISINIRISENCTEQSETFIAVMAHELSHLVLHAIRSPHKTNEFYTDLVPMIFGFSKIIESGRKITRSTIDGNVTITETTTFGYLSDKQFALAKIKVNSALEVLRHCMVQLQNAMTKLQRYIQRYNIVLKQFDKFLKQLDTFHHKAIKHADGHRIVSFHQIGYTDESLRVREESVKLLQATQSFYDKLYYTNHTQAQVQQYLARLNSQADIMHEKQVQFEDDIKTLAKYISPWYKIKVKMEANNR